MCTSETVFKFNCIMLIETTHLIEFEYYIQPAENSAPHPQRFSFGDPALPGVISGKIEIETESSRSSSSGK